MVSAIIPCHNYGKYIDFAIESILEQTYTDIEIIIVDDGSTDEFTINKLRQLSLPNGSVIFRKQGYPAAARNTGFEHAKGTYILILDADDLLAPSFVEKALQILEGDDRLGVVSSHVLNFGHAEAVWEPLGGGLENFIHKINCGSAALIRRAAWIDAGGFNERFVEGYEDWNFWIDITKRGWQIHIIPEILFYYRTKEYSRVTDTTRQHKTIYELIKASHPEVFRGT